MTRGLSLSLFLATCLVSAPLFAQDQTRPPAPASGESVGEALTGNPVDLVGARRSMMRAISGQIDALEAALPDASDDRLAGLQVQATSLSAMLKAFPHLFPASTDPSNADFIATGVDTDAAATIWTDFGTFYHLAHQGADSASRLAMATTKEKMTTLMAELRTSCESCHATFLDYQMPVLDSTDAGNLLDSLGF